MTTDTTEARTCPLGDDCDLTVAYMAGRSALAAENAALRADNDRLRGALTQAHDMLKGCTFQTMRINRQYVDRAEVVDHARAALDAKP